MDDDKQGHEHHEMNHKDHEAAAVADRLASSEEQPCSVSELMRQIVA